MLRIMLPIDVSPALADLASRRAWQDGLGWSEWLGREASRLLAERVDLVCWPAMPAEEEGR